MLEYIPTRQVHQRLTEGWEMVSKEPGDYAALMQAPQGWEPPLLDNTKPYRTCSMPGCDGVHKAGGYCVKHYGRFKRHGNPNIVLPKAKPAGNCSEDGCQKPHKGNGLCHMHFQRAWKAKRRAFQCREAA